MKKLDEDKPVAEPSDFILYIAKERKIPPETIKLPKRLLITYQRSTYENAKNLINGKPVDWWIYGDAQPFSVGQFSKVEIGLGKLWIGAPAAVMTLEEIIACGAQTVIEVGLAGGLQTYLRPGDMVVVTKAIRDEGTSKHYLPPKIRVESSERIRNKLIESLSNKEIKYFSGAVWTTDGVYRETRNKLRRFREAGILAVNMETSAIFASAKYRNIEVASVQVISDILTENGWLQAFGRKSVLEKTEIALKTAFEALSKS